MTERQNTETDRSAEPEATRRSREAAAAAILDLQKDVRPDPDGWSIRDYIDYGRR